MKTRLHFFGAIPLLALITVTVNPAVGADTSNLVVNGSFESGTNPGVGAQINAPDSATISGWMVASGSIDYLGTGWSAGDGVRSLDMSGSSAGTISQTVSGLAVGSVYRLSFLMAGNPSQIPPLPAVKRLRASVGSTSQEYSFTATGHSYSDMGWTVQTLEFSATASTMSLSFVSLTDGLGGAALDGVSIVLTTNTPGPPPPPPPANLVVNGSFEVGTSPGVGAAVNSPNSTTINGWTVASGSIDYMGTGWGAGDGVRALDLSGSSAGEITQSIAGFGVGYTYRLSFLLAGNPEGTSVKRLRASVGTNAQEFSFDVTGRSFFNMGWAPQTLEFTANASTMTLNFLSLTAGNAGPALDQVSIALTTNTTPTNLPPLIATQPTNSLVIEGSNATFTVEAVGTATLTYQWRFGGNAIAGETNPALNLLSVSQAQAGGYSVVVANAFGAVTSAVATLVVTNFSTAVFDVSDFSPAANPGVVWSYGWSDSVGGFQLLGASSPVNLSGVVVNSWRYGSATQPVIYWNGTTNTAVIQGGQGVYPPGTVWVTIGTDGTLQNFGAVRFTAPAGGASRYRLESSFLTIFSGPISGDTDIHIVKNGVEIFSEFIAPSSGTAYTNALNFAPGDTLDFLVGRGADGHEYASGLKVSARLVPVANGTNLPPVILSQPRSRTVLDGTNVSFTVLADGTPDLSYQWLHNDKALPDGTNSTLGLSNVGLVAAGPYVVIVANAFGSVTSQVATLTVTQPAASVRVVGGNAAGGGAVNLPVQIRANGNENALGFSLNFNAALLTFSGAALGSDVPVGATLLLNTNDVASGRIGLGVGLPADAALAQGTQEVVVVTFLVAPVFNQTTTTISFGDQPTLRQLSDTHAQVLPAVYVSGTAAISDSQVEGDLAPRPDGNRSVAIVDWVQMGRFVALLDPIGGSNEFQRADCAPRATKGNGIIGASDWVQVGRFAVGLDPLSIAGGPTEPDAGGGGAFSPASTGTKLSLMNSSIAQGQTNVVPVVLECQGGENAMTFSVTFDPAKLAFVGVAPGPAAVGATMNVNSSLAGTGKVGLALALPPGTSLAPGLREVIQFRFAALAPAPATAAVAFGNVPVPSEVSDALAIPMATVYVPGTVTVTPPPGPPLHITLLDGSLYITWPVSGAAGFNLEATAGALGTTWSTVPGVINIGEQKLVILTPGSSARYFRLKKP